MVGPVEFMSYCLATVMAAKEAIGEDYSAADYAKLKKAFMLEADRAMELLARTKSLDPKLGYSDAAKLIRDLRTDSESATLRLREFLVEEFGAEWARARFDITR